MESLEELPVIRPMKKEDYKQIAEIDKKTTGRDRLEYWKAKAETLDKESFIALVAEIKKRIVGFILGSISGWEYITPESIGWINTIVISPEYQRKGIGQMLVSEMIEYMKKKSIKSVYAFVYWRDFDLLKFFNAIGFEMGDMIDLKFDIA